MKKDSFSKNLECKNKVEDLRIYSFSLQVKYQLYSWKLFFIVDKSIWNVLFWNTTILRIFHSSGTWGEKVVIVKSIMMMMILIWLAWSTEGDLGHLLRLCVQQYAEMSHQTLPSSMVTVVEFYSEEGEIQHIFTSKQRFSKNFFIIL